MGGRKLKNLYTLLTLGLSAVLIVLAPWNVSAEPGDWAKNTEVKGDIRLRYQMDKVEGKADRSRGRARARVGFESEVNDKVKVGIGLASGGADSRSTNQTFEDAFSSKGINLDLAYVEVALAEPATLFGGKFASKEVLWHPSDLLWDGDITVEGGGVVLKVNPFFLNLAGFVLDENKAGADPALYAAQPGIKIKAGNLTINGAVAYYAFSNLKGAGFLPNSAETNSDSVGDGSGVLIYEYDAIVPNIEVSMDDLGALPHAAVFGEYVNNSDPSSEHSGYVFGFKVGDKKVKAAKQWQFKYLFRSLEKDAWPDFLSDSDFAGGGTGFEGHEVMLDIGLAKNVVLGLDYYKTEPIQGSVNQEVFQIDMVTKF